MKNVVVIYGGDDWDIDIPIPNYMSRVAFEKWYDLSREKGVEMFRSSISWYDQEKGVFKKGWTYKNGKWIKIYSEIIPDLIYDKVENASNHKLFSLKIKMTQRAKVFNCPLFKTLLSDKFSQYVLFREFMPESSLVFTKDELFKNIKRIKSKKVVIKELYGSGGFGVDIVEKDETMHGGYKYPVLVQEFLESNFGIPGFSKEGDVADLRLVYLNGNLIYSISRIAKNKSLYTNFHQGADAVIVPENKIPECAAEVSLKIRNRLEVFTESLYSIDLMFSNDGRPYLIEINTSPGVDLLWRFGSKEQINNFIDAFHNIIPA